MKLVDNVASWWKWHSTYCFAVLGALPTVWANSPDLQHHLTLRQMGIAETILAVISFLLRLRAQTSASLPKPSVTIPPPISKAP